MKWCAVFLGVCFLTSLTYKQTEFSTQLGSKDEILWNAGVKLKWEDFQGTPDSRSSYKAMTTTTISSKSYEFNDSVVEYEFLCLFDKTKSWKKIQTDNLLKHEQLHFDIAELATRKLRKEFSEYQFNSLKEVNAHIKKIFSNAVSTRKSLGQAYDSETKHGIIEEKQREWETRIAKELKELDAYAKTRVTIRRKKK